MKQKYRDALIEYTAMDRLIEEYRGCGDLIEFRSEIHNRKLRAQMIIATELGFKDVHQ